MKTTYLLLVSAVLVCCGENEGARDAQQIAAAMAVPQPMLASYAPIDKNLEEEAIDSDVLPAMRRKLIRNGRITFRTKDVTQTKIALSKICALLHAYLSNETQRDDSKALFYSQTIRVPESGFNELMAKIEMQAHHIDHRTVDTDDVTEEYIDIESRLKAKLALEKRYLDLLSKAQKVDELLQVEKEMSTVRGDIESMQGSLNYMRNRIAYSTLEVTYYEEKVITTDFGFASRVTKSLKTGWDDVLTFLVSATAVWPTGLSVIVMLIMGMKYWKKRKKRLAIGS